MTETSRTPEFHSSRDLPERAEDAPELFREMARIQHENGATFFRYTIVSPEYPNPPYPHGLYVEGWRTQPAEMPDFHPPVTAEPRP